VTPRPGRVRLRAYQVGFGDCLLLSVGYDSNLPDGRSERHVLIDCGTVERAANGPGLADIAEHIEEHCSGQLDVVVATHRHKDHIGGFGERRTREILDRLNPRVVIRPWTDVPEAERDDETLGFDAEHRRFLDVLDSLGPQAEALRLLAFDSDEVAARAAVLAEMGFTNVDAVALLEDWGSNGRAEYVKAGDNLDLSEVLPEVSVQVLGPPTLDQVPALTRYAKDSEEYWLALAQEGKLTRPLKAGTPASLGRARRVLASPGGLGSAEWLLRTLDSRRLSQGLEIVEALDDVLNNTSVILLVTVGSRRLLLPGDAQVENWSHTLDLSLGSNGRQLDTGLAATLAKVDLYKVGHHGSRNATPRRLTHHWARRNRATDPVVSVLTTKLGVFEKSHEGKVPKDELVAALRTFGPVHSTADLDPGVWWMDLEAPATGSAQFSYTPGPVAG